MTDHIDTVVIGAGVIGLAIARALAQSGRDVIVLEQADAIGTGTSSRNSEVIHAGIYYPEGSLKARLCVQGRQTLYQYCDAKGITTKRCGKLIVASTPDQMDTLKGLQAKAKANRVDDLQWLDRKQTLALEPALRAEAALLSPSTGIIDSHGYMLALQGDAEAAGAVIAYLSPVESGKITDGGFDLLVGGQEPSTLSCRTLVNAAGLGAQAIADKLDGLDADHIPPRYLAKGNYFTLAGRQPFSHLIYPVPEQAGLGVHLTLDLQGQARFGPDVEWVDDIDYVVDPSRGDVFYDAIRTYWPDLASDSLMPGYAGIRPKLQGPGEPAQDFLINGPTDHGISGLVNLFGIESPGLTASLAIADETVKLLS